MPAVQARAIGSGDYAGRGTTPSETAHATASWLLYFGLERCSRVLQELEDCAQGAAGVEVGVSPAGIVPFLYERDAFFIKPL